MRKLIFALVLAVPTFFFAQEAQKEVTEPCTIPQGFKEPKGKGGMLKSVGATVKDLKEHISVDRGVDVKDITVLQLSEQLGNAIYIVCVKGTKYKYRRSGSVFYRDAVENPLRDFNSGK